MIKSLFRNIRGIKKKNATTKLKHLKSEYDLKLISVCEPLVDKTRIDSYKLKIGYRNAMCNQANWLWVFFDGCLSGTVIQESDQFLTVKFHMHNFSFDFIAIFIHASCSAEVRLTLWNDISLILNCKIPYIVL